MLDESGARIILLVAPAGYGKTTLAHQWLEGKEAAWYRGSSASADVAALAVGLAAATAKIVPGAGAHMRLRLRATERPEADARILAEMLADDITEWPEEHWLVIDDYQFAMDAPACEDFVETFLSRADPFILIASRRRPRWATARQRMYGRVFEVDRTPLAMNRQEGRKLLSKRSDAAALLSQAAGWPAVIGLAALAGSAFATPAKLPAALYDYFAEELLHALADPERTALCQLAVIPSITNDAATHLLGDRLAHETLAQGIEHGLLRSLTSDQYDLHPLLRAFLQERLRGTEADVSATVTTVGDFLLDHELWDDALELAKQFRTPAFVDMFIRSAWESLLHEGRISTLASLVEFAAEIRLRSVLLDLVEAEIAFRQGAYRKAETLATEATRWLEDDHLLVRAHVRAGQSAHLEGRHKDAVAHHQMAQRFARTSSDQCDAIWGEFVSAAELEGDDCAEVLRRLESLGTESPTDTIRLANGRIVWATRSGTGIPVELFAANHSLPRVDDPLVRSAFLHVWAALLIYTGRYEEALHVTRQQIDELQKNRLEFAMPHTFLNEALALRGLRKFREALTSVQRAESDDGSNARVILAAQTCRIGIQIGKGDLFGALAVQAEVEPDSVARNVVAEFIATRALALACSGEQSAALEAVGAAQSLSARSEPHVISRLALAVASLHGQTESAKYDHIGEALHAVRTADHIDALVTAYRGCPALLNRAAGSDAFGSDLSAIVVRAKDIDLASRAHPTIEIPRAARNHSLTRREVEVIRLVSQGLRNKEIAERFVISEVTVKAHMRSIMRKLGARSRTHAVALFDDLG